MMLFMCKTSYIWSKLGYIRLSEKKRVRYCVPVCVCVCAVEKGSEERKGGE